MERKIIKFSASWCGPCKMLAMTLDGEDLGIPVESIDIDENSKLAREYTIRSVPTMVLVEGDREVKRLLGANTLEAIKTWIAE